MLTQTYEDGDTVTYKYDNNGALAKVTDSATGITTTYYYDLTDRMMKYVESGTGYSHGVEYTYDEKNNLKKLEESINGVDHITEYDYDDDNRVTSVIEGNTGVGYDYDDFGRLTERTITHSESPRITDTYTYTATEEGNITPQVSQLDHRIGATMLTLSSQYTYDGNGNITRYTYGPQVFEYTYDTANQLLSEENSAAQKRWEWEYDNAGNILSRKTYNLATGALIGTDTYTYDNSNWGDQLSIYNGTRITYDAIGNPLTDGTWTYTWEHGRQLASMTDGSDTWDFTYNADGIRTQRTNGTDTYTYIYSGSLLKQMTKGSDTLYFTYDANGIPVSVTHNNGTTTATYYYVTNLQGDVLHIFNGQGASVGSYTYDAWGNPVTTGTATICQLNPLRYRGYVYDQETGFYYLQSRYYNPDTGRFLNADALPSTGQGLLGNNMFAYCGNNPVNMFDPSGEIAITTLILIGSIALGVFAGGYTAYKEYQAGFSTARIIGDSLCAGFSAFSIAYTGGMSLYQCYQNYCYLNAITPVTHIGSTPNPAPQLQQCADTANSTIPGNGPAVGTKKHTVFAQNVNNLGRNDLVTEASYKNGVRVPYGTKGSIRFDVVQYNNRGIPIAAWDLKTGSATLSQLRIMEMQRRSGLSIPINLVR